MRFEIFVCFLCPLMLFLAGCKKSGDTPPPPNSQTASSQESGSTKFFDVCGLLEKQEIEAIQGSPIKETKSSARTDSGFRVSQCFYTAEEFSKSVSLALTQTDPTSKGRRSPLDFWRETFGQYAKPETDGEADKETRRDQSPKEEREKSIPPKKIDGIGDEAYWAGGHIGGALYVLKRDRFLRVSVGGLDKEEVKIDKSKKLAEKALRRL
jgi:hypothetical protein